MKKQLLLILLIFSAVTLTAQQSSLEHLVAEYAAGETMNHASWGVYAEYASTGKTIVDHNGEMALAPASGLKLFTTAAGLHLLGKDFTFQTRIAVHGSIDENGVLQGNLYIIGGGDPTLGSDRVDGSLPLDELMKQWTNAVKEAGIKRIAGSVIADDTFFDRVPLPDNWVWIDMGNYYGAQSSALTLHDNLYYLYFKPAAKVGGIAEALRTEPSIPGLEFDNHMRTGAAGSGDNGYIYAAPRQFNATLRGTIPAGVKEFDIKGSIPDPPLFTAQYFRRALETSGVQVDGQALKVDEEVSHKGAKTIHTTVSPPLKDIVYYINKRSFNLYTEQVLRMLGKEEYNEGSVDAGAKAIEQVLESLGVATGGLHLNDGCGLSRMNAITAKMMSQMLSAIKKQPYYDEFNRSLSVTGDLNDDGFFKRMGRGTAIENNARIKSGLIQGVRSFSGYLSDASGNLISFSMIANNYDGSSRTVDRIHQELMVALANLK